MKPEDSSDIAMDLQAITRHARRNRLSRFWHTAGPMNTLIVAAWCALTSFYIIALVRNERWIELAFCIVLPLLLAWPLSRLCIRYFQVTRHVMNVWAIGLIIAHIAARSTSTALPVWVDPAMLAAISVYVGTYFLVLSDWQITPSRN